jgi:hypothetical protein
MRMTMQTKELGWGAKNGGEEDGVSETKAREGVDHIRARRTGNGAGS